MRLYPFVLICSILPVFAQNSFTLPPGVTISGVPATSFVLPTGIPPDYVSSVVASLTDKVGPTLVPAVIASVASEKGFPVPSVLQPQPTTVLTGTLTPTTVTTGGAEYTVTRTDVATVTTTATTSPFVSDVDMLGTGNWLIAAFLGMFAFL